MDGSELLSKLRGIHKENDDQWFITFKISYTVDRAIWHEDYVALLN